MSSSLAVGAPESVPLDGSRVEFAGEKLEEAKKLPLEKCLPNPQQTLSLEKGCLEQDRQFPIIDPFVIFLNLCKHLTSLTQINSFFLEAAFGDQS